VRIDGAAEPLGAAADPALRCGGFFVVWLDDRPSMRLVSGERRIAPGIPDAVVDALADAPRLLREALGVCAPRRPWERVEVAVTPGARTGGEALSLGSGSIRLSIGEQTPATDAAAIARHEALHLLLAAALRGGEKWCDPEIAFTDWIVRGIEARPAAGAPRLRAPVGLLDPLPVSRADVQRRLHALGGNPAAARRAFGDALFAELQGIAQAGPADAVEQKQLQVTETALGAWFLDAAGRLWTQDADALRPILLDDWLIDYEQYARGVANPPRDAGHLWRIADAGWSRDAVVRLSVAAQALQRDDHCLFADVAPPHDAVVWKNRGRVRLPLVSTEAGPRPAPLQGFRAVLRAIDAGPRALALVEEAARGAEGFEARALWPRILARLMAAGIPWPEVAPAALAAVQVIDGEAFAQWAEAAEALRSLLGDRAAWLPRVLPPQPLSTLARCAAPPASILLVHGGGPSPQSLLASRQLAASTPVRGAIFGADLGGGAAYEQLPDLDAPLDPRYREEIWVAGPRPCRLEDLARLADEATASGRLSTPLSHLLSITAIGLEECHYPRAPAPAPRAAPA
jgi:hypothetical protein